MNFWKLKKMDLEHWKVKSNSIIFEAQTGGIKCNAWCRSVKTGELPNQEIKFKKKKTVQRPSVKKISFEKCFTAERGATRKLWFFSTMWREKAKPGERRCAIGLHGWFRLLCLEKIIQQQSWKNTKMEENMKFQNLAKSGLLIKNDSQMMFLKWKFKQFAIAFFYLRLQLSAWASQKGKLWAPKRLKQYSNCICTKIKEAEILVKAVFNDKEFQKQRK